MNFNIFNIKWLNITENILPYFWRNISLFGTTTAPTWLKNYVYCILFSIENLTNRLFEIVLETVRRLKYDGQLLVLETALNDYFDNLTREIYISEDFTNFETEFYKYNEPYVFSLDLYTEDETNPAPWNLYKSGESYDNYDFYVNTPVGLSFNQLRMEQIIDRYKMAGKRYLIQSY